MHTKKKKRNPADNLGFQEINSMSIIFSNEIGWSIIFSQSHLDPRLHEDKE